MDIDTDGALRLLECGDIAVKGRMPWSSNATFLAEVTHDGTTALAVYKSGRGERELWDFPRCVYRREVASWALSDALGWGIVPPTVLRHEGPLGEGSLQWFVAADFEQHYFTLQETGEYDDALKTVCAFDLVANNTDRKSGHVLVDEDGGIWAIDNSLTFHEDFKLRTVIWEYATESVPEPLLEDLARFVREGVPESLTALLSRAECRALVARAESVIREGRFPLDPSGRRYPWPLV